MEKYLPVIPAKRYFTISEVGSLCGVKPHVLRYWEQEFSQLRPTKRRGNRRYYQLYEVQLVRKICELLYEQGFTIVGARNKLQELVEDASENKQVIDAIQKQSDSLTNDERNALAASANSGVSDALNSFPIRKSDRQSCASESEAEESSFGTVRPLLHQVRDELLDIRNLLAPSA